MDQSLCCTVASLTQKYEGHFYASTSPDYYRAKSCSKAWQLPKAFQKQGWLQQNMPPPLWNIVGPTMWLSSVFSNLNTVWKRHRSFWASRLLKKMCVYYTKTLHQCMSDPRGKREGNNAAFCTHVPLPSKKTNPFLFTSAELVSALFSLHLQIFITF